jgi:hypothetical protein
MPRTSRSPSAPRCGSRATSPTMWSRAQSTSSGRSPVVESASARPRPFRRPCDDVRCQALAFVENIAKSFRAACLPFAAVAGALGGAAEARVVGVALRCTGDNALLDPALAACARMLASDAKVEACESIALIARAIPVNRALVNSIADTIAGATDPAVLAEALAKLVRREAAYLEPAQALIERIFAGEISFLDGAPERLFARFNPPNLDHICQFAVEWLRHAPHLVVTSIVGLLTDAVVLCDVNPAVVAATLEFLDGLVALVDDTDLRQNIIAYLTALADRIRLARVAAFVPVAAAWWVEGRAAPVGQALLLSNIGLFALEVCAKGAEMERSFLLECVGAFPPADVKDTNEMALILLQLLERENAVDFVTAALIAIASLLTEPPAVLKPRKLRDEVFRRLQTAFREFVSGQEELKLAVLRSYDGFQEKQAAITEYFDGM